MTIDPVCHTELDPSEAAATLTYGEEVYCFCSKACRDRFLQEPGYWLEEEMEEERERASEV